MKSRGIEPLLTGLVPIVLPLNYDSFARSEGFEPPTTGFRPVISTTLKMIYASTGNRNPATCLVNTHSTTKLWMLIIRQLL